MKLNKIQTKIYDEYAMTGKVWADCSRQSGKTELLIFIAKNELKCGNTVCIKSFSKRSTDRIINAIPPRLRKNIVDEKAANVVLYDEIYYDLLQKPSPKRIVCLRTKLHKTLKFTYLDLGPKTKMVIEELKNSMSKEQWEREFN